MFLVLSLTKVHTGIDFVCKRDMDRDNFKFQNTEYCAGRRPEPLSESKIKKLLLISSLTVSLSFLVFKIFPTFSFKKSFSFFKINAPQVTETADEHDYVLPLLVNLKGEEGPQLAKIHVYITLGKNSSEKEFLSPDNKLEKHLLFVLSGQSVKILKRKKDHLEKQIRSQLNAFLTDNFVHGVRIQTEMLN